MYNMQNLEKIYKIIFCIRRCFVGLNLKEERMKEFESQLTGKNKILHDSKLINDIRSLKSGESHEGACNSENVVCLILFTNTSL